MDIEFPAMKFQNELITTWKECQNCHGNNEAIIEPVNPIHNPIYKKFIMKFQ